VRLVKGSVPGEVLRKEGYEGHSPSTMAFECVLMTMTVVRLGYLSLS